SPARPADGPCRPRPGGLRPVAPASGAPVPELPVPALDLPAWDPAVTWRRLQATSTDGTNRLDPAADLAFWERIAPNYHLDCLAARVPETVERVLRHVAAGDSVLEVGAGSGGFTLPIA